VRRQVIIFAADQNSFLRNEANKCFGCNNDSVQEVIITSKSDADGFYIKQIGRASRGSCHSFAGVAALQGLGCICPTCFSHRLHRSNPALEAETFGFGNALSRALGCHYKLNAMGKLILRSNLCKDA
jgi:hypothetical protein